MTRIIVRYRDVGDLPAIAAAVGGDVRRIAKVVPRIRLARLEVEDAASALALLNAPHPLVEEAWREGAAIPAAAYHSVTNDPLLADWRAWLHRRVNAYHAHRYTTGSPSVLVVVTDDGNVAHPDLPLPTYGYHAVDGTNDPSYTPWGAVGVGRDPHGMRCRSFICATPSNGAGVAGIAPGCTHGFVALATMDMDGAVIWPWLDCVESLYVATDWGVDNDLRTIISCSWGFTNSLPGGGWAAGDIQAMQDALDYAWSHNALVFVCAHNQQSNLDLSGVTVFDDMKPAEMNPVITVGATDRNDAPAWFSNFGAVVDLGAPGLSVAAYYDQDTGQHVYATVEGTSFATPTAASVAALIWSENPALTNAQVRDLLLDTCSPANNPNFAVRFPSAPGIPDAGRAVTRAHSTAAAGVYPYVAFALAPPYSQGDGIPPRPTNNDPSNHPPDATGPFSVTTVSGGVATTTLDGPVLLDVGGYSGGADVDEVEVSLGGAVIYSGPPARLTGTASASGTALPLSVRARSGSTWSEAETYTDVVVSSLALSTGVEATAPAAVLALSGAAPSLARVLHAPPAAVNLAGQPPTASVFDRLIALGPPGARMALDAVPPSSTLRSLTAWRVGGRLKLSTGREVPLKVFTT